MPLLLLVVLPGLAALSPRLLPASERAELRQLVDSLPPALRTSVPASGSEQQVIVLLLTYLFGPLYLLVPVMVANVAA